MQPAISIVVDVTGEVRARLLAPTDRQANEAAWLADVIEPRLDEMRQAVREAIAKRAETKTRREA